MMAQDPKEWLKDYSDFLSLDQEQVPADLNQRVTTQIRSLLNPSAWWVFAKLLAIHLVVGFFSLGICHQFDMNPFGTTRSLSDWFMQYGMSACMIGCGVIFVSFSVLAAGYFLTVEEVRVLRRTEFIQSIALGVVSISLFAAFGAELAFTFVALWLLGVLVGGFLAAEAAWRLKTGV